MRRHGPSRAARTPRRLDLSALPVVDDHCHPLRSEPWRISPAAFLALFSEGRPGAMTAHIPHAAYFQRAVRALAHRLGVKGTVEAVLARREQAGAAEAGRWLAESRVTALLVDTGYPPEAMPLSAMRRLLPLRIHEVFRIETCAEGFLPKALGYDEFLDAFRRELLAAAERCVAFKTIVAYRSGLAIRPWTPGDAARAYETAVTRVEAGGPVRLVEKPLLDTLVAVALDVATARGRPLQVHTGLGDPDIDLAQANPLLLRPVLEEPRWAAARIVLLHLGYPYFREAAFMAAVWPQVYVDLSLALPLLGPGAIPPLVETLALAPASKLLYGSDAGSIPELYALAADGGRAALRDALAWLVECGGLTREDALAAGRRVLSENAVTLYHLAETR